MNTNINHIWCTRQVSSFSLLRCGWWLRWNVFCACSEMIIMRLHFRIFTFEGHIFHKSKHTVRDFGSSWFNDVIDWIWIHSSFASTHSKSKLPGSTLCGRYFLSISVVLAIHHNVLNTNWQAIEQNQIHVGMVYDSRTGSGPWSPKYTERGDSICIPLLGRQGPFLSFAMDFRRPLTLDQWISRLIILLYAEPFCIQCWTWMSEYYFLFPAVHVNVFISFFWSLFHPISNQKTFLILNNHFLPPLLYEVVHTVAQCHLF